ncbi:MAG: hypothetical protein AAB866_02920, partial [Patescibacteria group bacterium]
MDATLALLIKYKYVGLFPLAAIEGPMVSLIVGFLVHLGYLEFIPSYIILILGDIIPDSIYFYIGRLGDHKKITEKYGPKLKGIAGSFEILEKLWRDHPRKTMFFGKLAYSLSIPFLISAGLVKMSFKKFITYAIPATLFQYGLLMLVGYYLGKSFELAINYIKYGGILIAILLSIFVIAY